MFLAMCDDPYSTAILASGDVREISWLEPNKVLDFAGSDVQLDGVVYLDEGVWVTDRSPVVGDECRDAFSGRVQRFDAAQFVRSLVLLDAVDQEASLHVEQHAEVLARLLDGDDVLEAGWEAHVRADSAVNLDGSRHRDLLGFVVGQGVLELVPDHHDQRHGLPELVGSGARARRELSRQLVQHPFLGRVQTLQVLFGSSCHSCSNYLKVS